MDQVKLVADAVALAESDTALTDGDPTYMYEGDILPAFETGYKWAAYAQDGTTYKKDAEKNKAGKYIVKDNDETEDNLTYYKAVRTDAPKITKITVGEDTNVAFDSKDSNLQES